MKKKISLLCLLAFLNCGIAFAVNSKPMVELEQMYNRATGDKVATMPEIEQLLQQIAKTQAQKLSDAESKKVALLTTQVLRHKYSLLESPQFQNNKGGMPLLQQAKKVATDWLSKHPNDVEMLFSLLDTQATASESTRETLARLLKAAPNNSWVHFQLASNFQKEKNYERAMQSLAQALRLEKDMSKQVLFMENGIDFAQDSSCQITDELRKLLAKVPAERLEVADEGQKKSPQYQQALRDMEKVRQDFLLTYVHKNCLSKKP